MLYEVITMIRNYLTFFFILTVLFFAPLQTWAVEVGKPAPGFTAKTVDGKSVSLADFKGRNNFV